MLGFTGEGQSMAGQMPYIAEVETPDGPRFVSEMTVELTKERAERLYPDCEIVKLMTQREFFNERF